MISSFITCSYPEISSDILVYENSFENDDLSNIDGGGLSKFNGTTVIGDFYIHGSWDGNFNGSSEQSRVPDKWIMEFKPEMDLYNHPDYYKYVTTFSNSPCYGNYCLKQSYPNLYPFSNNPKKGSFTTDLPRKCDGFFGGPSTTLYKIEKGFKSSGNVVVIRFYDELWQPNAIDDKGIPQQKCDESWSMDNISIRVINYK